MKDLTIMQPKLASERISIDDWIQDNDKCRSVESDRVRSLYDSRNPNKLPFCCVVRQLRPIHISAYGFGSTCGEAFWNAVQQFTTGTGGCA